MNGRIYDPLLGRFLSADTFVQFPGSLQAYNRYSYVLNNPLTFNDPSGHFIPLLIPGIIALTATETAVVGTGVVVAGVAATPQGREAAGNVSRTLSDKAGQALRATARFLQNAQAPSGNPMVTPDMQSMQQGLQMRMENSQAASQQASNAADQQSSAPKPAVDGAKTQEGSSGGQMDPKNNDPKKDDKDKMAKVRQKGKEGEAQMVQKIPQNGETVTGQQVTVVTSKGTRTVIDATSTDGQKNIANESKNGPSARLTQGQKDLQSDAANQKPVTPVGDNAAAAGYTPGQPITFDEYNIYRNGGK